MSAVKIKATHNPRCLLIGGGLTASLLSYLLHKSYPSIYTEVWEKNATIGGRMMTVNSQATLCSADIGAQYITTIPTQHSASQKMIYSELIDSKILSPLNKFVDGDRKPNNAINFVAANGMASIVKHLFSVSGTNIFCNRHVKKVQEISGAMTVSCHEAITDIFEIVIFTIPVPEIYDIYDKAITLLQSKVQFSTRYALALFYKNQDLNKQFNWCARYINENPCLRFVSIDTKKRDAEASGTSIVLHSSVSFAELNQDVDPVNVKQEMLAHLDNVMPGLPSANESTLVNWKYSQVMKAHSDNAAFILNKFPLLITGGDSFTTSRFDGCLISASAMSKTIVDTLKSSSGNL